jgi:Uma2 family endonuclease
MFEHGHDSQFEPQNAYLQQQNGNICASIPVLGLHARHNGCVTALVAKLGRMCFMKPTS